MIAVAELDDILDAAHTPYETADGFTVKRAAEILSRDPLIDLGRSRLFEHMHALGWTTRDNTGRWIATTAARMAGHLIVRDTVVRVGPVDRQTVPQLYITLPGLTELRRTLARPPDTTPAPTLFD